MILRVASEVVFQVPRHNAEAFLTQMVVIALSRDGTEASPALQIVVFLMTVFDLEYQVCWERCHLSSYSWLRVELASPEAPFANICQTPRF